MENVQINLQIRDNGAVYCILVDGLTVHACSSLGDAWRHIEWMYRVASQQFTVGDNRIPVASWIARMKKAGFLD